MHFGSLVAAVASFLQARAAGGEWLVRIEDLDPPRTVPGAAASILRTLERLGLHWDGAVMYQSTRDAAYRDAYAQLQAAGALYPCGCSRKEIADSSIAGIDGPVYPGTCRAGLAVGKSARAWRVRTDDSPLTFHDAVFGRIERVLARDIGDFIVRRADGLFAYQLAVTVDDAAQGITDVVRGADLLESTARQIHLQRLLGYPTPTYMHVPVAVAANGEKLSKQNSANLLEARPPLPVLARVLRFLGQSPPPADEPPAFWQAAIAAWSPARVPRVATAVIEKF